MCVRVCEHKFDVEDVGRAGWRDLSGYLMCSWGKWTSAELGGSTQLQLQPIKAPAAAPPHRRLLHRHHTACPLGLCRRVNATSTRTRKNCATFKCAFPVLINRSVMPAVLLIKLHKNVLNVCWFEFIWVAHYLCILNCLAAIFVQNKKQIFLWCCYFTGTDQVTVLNVSAAAHSPGKGPETIRVLMSLNPMTLAAKKKKTHHM